MYLFDDVPIHQNRIPVILSEEDINNIKNLCNQHKLSVNKVGSLLCENVNGFNHLVKIWDTAGFANFSLTAIGIAIGRAYLEQTGFGNYDIKIWIN